VTGVLQWLHAQATALLAVVSAAIGNKPEPARQVFIYTIVLIALAWAAPKIAKLAKK
jgi:hypothetical protein